MRSQRGAVEQTAARTGDRQLFRRRRIDAQLQRSVPHVGENLVVGERASRQRVQVVFQFRAGQLAAVMLEETDDPPLIQQGGNRVEVPNVDNRHRVGCRNDRIIERTENRGRPVSMRKNGTGPAQLPATASMRVIRAGISGARKPNPSRPMPRSTCSRKYSNRNRRSLTPGGAAPWSKTATAIASKPVPTPNARSASINSSR